MACNGCEQNVENVLRNLDGVIRVDADHEGNIVEVVSEEDMAEEDLRAAIEQAGYDVAA